MPLPVTPPTPLLLNDELVALTVNSPASTLKSNPSRSLPVTVLLLVRVRLATDALTTPCRPSAPLLLKLLLSRPAVKTPPLVTLKIMPFPPAPIPLLLKLLLVRFALN